MAPERLLPAERAKDCVEALLAERRASGQPLYLLILALVLGGLTSLPLIRVPVWVQSSGIIRPALEKHEVRAGVTGIVAAIPVRENQRVERGEVIATLQRSGVDARDRMLLEQLQVGRGLVHDLEALVAADSLAALEPERLRTARYRAELVQVVQTLEEQRQRVGQAARDAGRARELYARALISLVEMEQQTTTLERESLAAALLVQRARRDWEAALGLQREALRELEVRGAELRQQREMHAIVSPVAGTVEQLASLSPGSLVQAGEAVAVISPGARLIAEVHVTPRQIGLLRPGAPVRMRVDAFHSSDWGFLRGEVAEIPGDFVLLGQAPHYRVKVALHSRGLVLPDGTRGELRKGMTLEARFILTERTLWQLLRDDVNDWFGRAPRHDPSA